MVDSMKNWYLDLGSESVNTNCIHNHVVSYTYIAKGVKPHKNQS